MNHRLDFIIQSGIAKNWQAILTNEELSKHRNKYTFKYRPYMGEEYFNDNFIDDCIEKALNDPRFVFPNIQRARPPENFKHLNIREGKEWVVFYSDIENKFFKDFNGNFAKENIKIVVKRIMNKQQLIIRGFRKTSHIPEADFVLPLKKITDINTIALKKGYKII